MNWKTRAEWRSTRNRPAKQMRAIRNLIEDLKKHLRDYERLPRKFRIVDGHGLERAEQHITQAFYETRRWLEAKERDFSEPSDTFNPDLAPDAKKALEVDS